MTVGYYQFCPVAKAAELLCERWTLIVVRELMAGSRHFNDLRRGLPRMSPTLLSTRLKQMVESGIAKRIPQSRGRCAYELTQAGQELAPLIEMMAVWGHRWIDSHLHEHDLDAGLLMWDIRRGVDGTAFPTHRVTVKIDLADAPKGMRHWWLVSEAGQVDLCMEDPGHEIDMLIQSRVRALTAVWMYRQTLHEAQHSGDIVIVGSERLKRSLPKWLVGSPLARKGAESLAIDPIVSSPP